MQQLTSGAFVGAGSFRCTTCGYVLSLSGSDTLSDCPSCGGRRYTRASLFGPRGEPDAEETGRVSGERPPHVLAEPAAEDITRRLAVAREHISEPGEYLSYEVSGRHVTVPLTREWTRIGRSLAADVRFDDPTVSRRHALIVRSADGLRLLDDRSLNGVFVNGSRIDGRKLRDGDEIIVGRYRLLFVSVPAEPLEDEAVGGAAPGELHAIG